jgi:two-component system, OmpR family, response regulator
VSQRILVVEDDAPTRALISEYLAENHFQVVCAETGTSAEAALRANPVDLVLLDLNLPDQDGLMLARKLGAEHVIPIVILTGRADEMDRVLGLELGADDYVTKPFSPRELLARVRAVLRRAQSNAGARSEHGRGEHQAKYRFAGFELRMGTRKLITPDGRQLDLTSGEFSLLAAFLKSPQQILSRDQLLEASRMYDDVYDRSIDVQILRLRRKIEDDPSSPRLIRTERGAGYYLDCKVESG